MPSSTPPPSDPAPTPIPLTEPSEGVPAVTESSNSLGAFTEQVARGRGPIAVDAERASGFRYGQDAYLVQVRREGAGTALIDPQALPDLSPLSSAIADVEWVLHAANQDLPCLADVGMVPAQIFDTELAGRLLNKARVGLGPLVEAELGYALAKEHSAADWSIRPLPEDWLKYAALDVEVLVELRDVLADQLAAADKLGWALEEFAAILTAPPTPPRVEPWRRTSGTHQVRDPRQLAIVRSLWQTREAAAQRADRSPGRILPDAAIIAAALAGTPDLGRLKPFQRHSARRRLPLWGAAVQEALELPDSELPNRRPPQSDIPQPRFWKDRDPDAAHRLDAVKRVVRSSAADLDVPQENLLTPDYQRRIAWDPPRTITEDATAEKLTELGARTWQVDHLATGITDALRDPIKILETIPDPADERRAADEA